MSEQLPSHGTVGLIFRTDELFGFPDDGLLVGNRVETETFEKAAYRVAREKYDVLARVDVGLPRHPENLGPDHTYLMRVPTPKLEKVTFLTCDEAEEAIGADEHRLKRAEWHLFNLALERICEHR